MRNLKKILALVLALVMSLSLVTIAGAASTGTTSKYADAIKALENYKVLQGYTDKQLHENDNITRAQMAALVYRVMTGDTQNPTATDATVATKYGNYANKYKDVNKNAWYIGYIGWCTNQGVLKGYGDGTVKPDEQIKGYEVQAMLLRALGYDQNNEYTGKNWEYKVLADATKAGINKNVDSDPAKVTPRGAVAQLTYNAATKAKRVAPAVYPTVGYSVLPDSLIEATSSKTYDVWGAPSTKYDLTFTWPDIDVETHPVVADKALATYYGPVTECDVADDLGIKGGNYDTYTNGKGNKGTQYISDTDTTNKIGAQGRQTIVYADRIIYKDTFLAEVTGVTVPTYDVAGHEITPAGATLTIYGNVDAEGVPAGTAIDNVPGNAVSVTSIKVKGSYTMGQMLTVNFLTGTANNDLDGGTAPADPRVYNAQPAAPVSVTVAAIIYDGNTTSSQNIVGFVGTNGVRYLYDVTYGYYNKAGANTTLTNTAIGKTYSVYTDGRNNVLGINPAAADQGVGVVTGFKAVSLGTATSSEVDYVVDYQILGPDGSTKTVRGASNGTAAYAGEGAAIDAAQKLVGHLVSYAYAAPTTDKYLTVTATTATGDLTAKKAFEIGDADTIDTTHLVDDKTVFFVANYTMNNSLNAPEGAYVPSGYSVYTGFQNLPYDYKMGAAKIMTAEGVDTKAKSEQIAWEALTATPNDTFSGAHARYVLILNGTEKVTNVAQTVPSYAYVNYNDQLDDIYQEYWQFNNVLVNGSKTTLKLTNTAGAVITASGAGSGLYTYADATNGAYGTVVRVNEVLTSNNWTITDGVLALATTVAPNALTAIPAGWNNQYYTVTANTQIYIVNNNTGAAYKFNGDLKAVKDTYNNPTIYFQLNQYGWINFVYVVDNMTGGAPTTSQVSAATITGANSLTAGDPYLTEDDITIDSVTPGTATVTVESVEWYYADASTGGQFTKITKPGVFVAGTSYRALITVSIEDSAAARGCTIASNATITNGSVAGAYTLWTDAVTVS